MHTVLGELFFVRKVPLTPSKDRFAKSVPLSADSGSGLCPESLPPFEKGGRKLLVLLPIMRTLRTSTQNRKKLVATAKRRERIYKRTAEPSVTFCGEEEQRNGRLIFCVAK